VKEAVVRDLRINVGEIESAGKALQRRRQPAPESADVFQPEIIDQTFRDHRHRPFRVQFPQQQRLQTVRRVLNQNVARLHLMPLIQ